MPQVPIQQGPRAQEAALATPTQQVYDVTNGMGKIGEGMAVFGLVADKIAEREAETEAWKAQAEINDAYLKWNNEQRKNKQGDNAKGHAAAVQTWWEEAKAKYTDALSPRAQRLIGRSLATVRNSATQSALEYESQQLEIGNRAALIGSVSSLGNQAIAAGPDKAPAVLAQGIDTLRSYAAKKGVDMEPEVMKFTTGVHITLINQLMQRDPKAAELYFNTHKPQIDGQRHDEITSKLNAVSAVTDGEAKATEIWNATVKPGDYKNPVDTYALIKQAKEAFPNDPTRARAATDALNQYTAAWNKSQLEFNAANTNTVWGMLDGKTPLTTVMRSEAWNNLPAVEQANIRRRLEADAATEESRVAAREARDAAREQRAYTAEMRQERMLLRTNAADYLADSDPEKLRTMTRPQVEALRTKYGFEPTQHLLGKWEALQKGGAVGEAKMDTEDFNRVAETLNLRPFDPKKSEAERAALGNLKYMVERVIDTKQRELKRPLTRPEKDELMRTEMAKTVTINPGLFAPRREIPVIQMTAEQINQVEIPAAQKPQLAAEMKQLYSVGQNPQYAPTEANLKRYFLMKRSPTAAKFIGQGQ